MNVNRANRLTDLLPNSKRNEIIIGPSFYSYKNSYVKHSRNAGLTQAPFIGKNKYKEVRYKSRIGNTGTRIKPIYK
jgi:hypothetical protein